MNRVVVTGFGVLSPIGNTAKIYWENLIEGVSGLAPITLVPPDDLSQKIVAEVKNFDPQKHFDERQIVMMDRVAQFAVVTAREAIEHAGITFDERLSARTATIIGVGSGGHITLDDNYRRLYRENKSRVFPLTIPKMMVNAPASQVSIHCGLRGPAFTVASACASANHAIGISFQMLRSGQVDCAVTGGTEASIAFGTMKGWEAMRVMAPDACRPFSKDRKGMVIGEGAAMFVLETLHHAQARGAEISRRDSRRGYERRCR